ncbi:MAG: peptidoglycan D,D-transpeptidase FtsI family protein [Methylococcales bacterium]
MIDRYAPTPDYSDRRHILLLCLFGVMVMLFGRAIDLQLLETSFLKKKAEYQYLSAVPISAYRGNIVDRNGEPLAISTLVHSIWVDPQQFETTPEQRNALAELLKIPVGRLDQLTPEKSKRRFVYLRRHISPELEREVAKLDVPGVNSKREYKRYYPAGEITSHLIGFTNIDDRGQEGIELAFQKSLQGATGKKTIIRDGKRNAVTDVATTHDPVPGKDLRLTIDERLQYIAYRELKAAFIKHRAHSASLALLDARNGDVLAMVNQPSYNPNSAKSPKRDRYRNRALTDVFEPGSTMKPFAVACALENGLVRPDTIIDTNPGSFRVGNNLVRDIHNYGVLNVARILQKSSNVGVSKLALKVSSKTFLDCYRRFGFGQAPETGFPGEASGKLRGHGKLRPFEQAIMSFGYGLSGSALQLARAYTVFSNDGEIPQVRLVEDDRPIALPSRVLSRNTAQEVRDMLELVVSREGTALQASVPGFRISGKTGTVKKVGARGYSSNRYLAVFAGLAPASRPRIVMVVVVDEPSTGVYYGGLVAAPVFSRVMDSVLRLLGIQPDQGQFTPLMFEDTEDTI